MSVRIQILISVGIILAAAAVLLIFLPPAEGGNSTADASPSPSPSPVNVVPVTDAGTPEPSETPAAETPRPAETASPEPTVQPTPEGDAEIDDTQSVLPILLGRAGYDESFLPGSQLIVVDSYGSEADLYRFELLDGVWTEEGSVIHAWIGENGLSWEKQEGDGTTPGGLYLLGHGFGNETPDEVSIDYRAVTEESYWVDDPDSAFYNTWVEGAEGQDWSSAEVLAAFPEEYAFAVVIEYNTHDTVYGAGSAIFLHCGTAPTAGCVAVEREHMLEILRWLQPGSDAAILMY